MRLAIAEESIRRASDPEVLVPPPISEVVPRFLAALGKIRNLVVMEAARLERSVDRQKRFGDAPVVANTVGGRS